MRAQILILFFVALCKAAADDTLELKVRIQPRADFGQFADGDGYGNRLDLYIRRSRLEMLGKPTEGVFYILAVAGDRLGQRGASAGSDLAYAFVDYQIGALILPPAGRPLLKLPFSRSALVTSSRLALIERSLTVATAVGTFGQFITPHLAFLGQLRNKSIRYTVAIMDGLEPGDADRMSGLAVAGTAGPGFVARLEYSPPGWLERRESESHLGVGRHLTIALNGARQSAIEFPGIGEEDRLVVGGDFSIHRGAGSLQAEYLRVTRDGSTDISPSGWYLQMGRYLAGTQLEPAVRFERFDADLPGGDDITTVFTGGLNWYRHGHDLKFAANIVHTRFQTAVREVDDESSRTVLQLQNQIYF